MALVPGAQIGSYQILSLVGAGGMGEVYRAHDSRLGRDVAIKVLPASWAADPERLRRFEQEARAASTLNHPGIITIHEIDRSEWGPYLVMEFVQGTTLRDLLRGGPMSLKKAVAVASQVADALAVAHSAGITHRDLKPENIMVTESGLTKILDFGLAKLIPESGSDETLTKDYPAAAPQTRAGVILGTAGYMAPEQAVGRPADYRSDQFSFGAMVYEMLTGKSAFLRATAVESMAAIVREEPEAIAALNSKVPPPLRWIVERCLSKEPPERYASTLDLARDLHNVRTYLVEAGTALSGASVPLETPVPQVRLGRRTLAIGLTGSLLLLAGAWLLGHYTGNRDPWRQVRLHQLTFRNGIVSAARYAPDGHSVVYAANWGGSPSELFTTDSMRPESRPLGIKNAGLFSVSSTGELAMSMGCELNWSFCSGTLAQAALAGGAPRLLMEGVDFADWSRDGKDLVVVRAAEGHHRLEYPPGKVLYETGGWLQNPRISPDGKRIAFIEHPALGDSGGSLSVLDIATGEQKSIAGGWLVVMGLAWSPAGDEIWVTGGMNEDTAISTTDGVYAVNLAGRVRRVFLQLSGTILHDISSDGRALITRITTRTGNILSTGRDQERDVSWSDGSTLADLSSDGTALLFFDVARAPLRDFVFLSTAESPGAVPLGEGQPIALSPDKKWALAVRKPSRSAPSGQAAQQLVLYPTGAGEHKELPRAGLMEYQWGAWFPDGGRVLFVGAEADRRLHTYVQDVFGGDPKVVSPTMLGVLLSPDGHSMVAYSPDGDYYLYPLGEGAPRPVPGMEEGDRPIQWSADSRYLYLRSSDRSKISLFRLDLASGRREPWKELMPADPTGIIGLADIPGELRLTPDGRTFAYTYWRVTGELYEVEGLK